MPNCPNCGRPYVAGPDEGRYCESCGYDLSQVPQPQLAPASATPPAPVAPVPSPRPATGGGPSRVLTVVLVVLIVLFAGLFAYTFVTSSSTISGLNRTVSTQSSQITQQASTIAYDANQISGLQSQVSTLQTQVSSDQAEVATLNSRLATANSTISTDAGQIASLDSQISTLNSQISSDQSQIASLQAEESAFVVGIENALSEPKSIVFESNYGYSIASDQYATFSYTSGGTAEVWLVSVSGSTSADTLVGTNLTSTNTFNIGSSGVVVFDIPAYTAFTISIYDSNYAAYSATVSIWAFY